MMADRVPLLAGMVPRLQALALSPAAIVAEAGLPATLLQQVQPTVSTAQFFALWRAIQKLSGDPLIGLRLVSEASTAQLDPVAIAALHSADFGQALERMARYKRLCCPEEIRVETRGREARICFRWLHAQGAVPHEISDGAFAAVLMLGRHGSGQDLRPLRVELSRTATEARALRPAFEKYFGCGIRTGAAEAAIVFPSEALGTPFVTRNDDLLAVMVPGLDARLASVGATGTVAQARALLMKAMRGESPSIVSLAAQLHVSSRTLQRRLGEAGTSYQMLLDEVRLDTARQLLAETHMTPGEIAFFLGFEEVNSFQRAFRRWEGVTPVQWRRGLDASRK